MSWGKELDLLWTRLADHQPTNSNNPSGWMVIKKQTKMKAQGHQLHKDQGLLGLHKTIERGASQTVAIYTKYFFNHYNSHFVCKAHLATSHANIVRDNYQISQKSCKLSYLL